MSESLVLQLPSGPTAVTVRLQPLVIFSICDYHMRRQEGFDRVVGTLLGSILADGTVEVKNVYAVPHNEAGGQVSLDIEHHKTMLDLHQKVNPKETVVGWYASGAGITASDPFIHEFYAGQTLNPVHVTVATEGFGKPAVRAYVCTGVVLGDVQVGSQFHEVQLDLKMGEAERIGFENLKKTVVQKLPSDLEGLEDSILRLQHLVEQVFSYVDDVVAGRTAPDNSVGRYLADTVSSVPHLKSDTFDKMLNDSVQDLLLVLYLTNLTRTQLVFAEKLNAAAQAV